VSVHATAWTLADLAAQNGYPSGHYVLTEERLALIQQRIRHVYRRQRPTPLPGRVHTKNEVLMMPNLCPLSGLARKRPSIGFPRRSEGGRSGRCCRTPGEVDSSRVY
jgi:hypothetical protein